MRRRVDVHALAGGFRHGPEEGAGAAFAVGAGDMDDWRQPLFRMAEACKKGLQAVEAEVDQPGMQAFEACS